MDEFTDEEMKTLKELAAYDTTGEDPARLRGLLRSLFGEEFTSMGADEIDGALDAMVDGFTAADRET